MTLAAAAWSEFTSAEAALDAALAALDADAILAAAADLHAAAAQLAQPGLVRDGDLLAEALQSALKRIESCRLRVMFLADHGARRVEALTAARADSRRWRPDRAA